jgi:hypothetical protein
MLLKIYYFIVYLRGFSLCQIIFKINYEIFELVLIFKSLN